LKFTLVLASEHIECVANNLSGGVALEVLFTTNGMRVKKNTHTYVARKSNNRVISSGEVYRCLLPQCEALRTCRSGFPIATHVLQTFVTCKHVFHGYSLPCAPDRLWFCTFKKSKDFT